MKKVGQDQTPLAMKAYSNRAACYKQISNFDGTIEGELKWFRQASLSLKQEYCDYTIFNATEACLLIF